MHTDLMRRPFDPAQATPADTSVPREAAARSASRQQEVVFDPETSFGAHLRAERERRSISIASIADSTKILGALLEGLENDDVSRWPTGLYRRAFIRAYARAVGLDPEPVVREFIARFPDPEEVTVNPAPSAAVSGVAPRAVLRLTLAEAGGTFAGGDLVREAGRRLVAVAADAAVLGLVGTGLYLVLGAFWAPLTVAVVGYYFGSILLIGNTPGVCLVASRTAGDRRFGPVKRTRRLVAEVWSRVTAAANHWRSSSAAFWRAWLER